MKLFPLTYLQKAKLLSCTYFIIIGILNLTDTVFNHRETVLRDSIFLLVLSLPLLVNKRLFYLVYGFLASLFSLVVLIGYIVTFLQSPLKAENSVLFFLLGCVVLSIGMACSLGLIYIGTYSEEKNRFKLA